MSITLLFKLELNYFKLFISIFYVSNVYSEYNLMFLLSIEVSFINKILK